MNGSALWKEKALSSDHPRRTNNPNLVENHTKWETFLASSRASVASPSCKITGSSARLSVTVANLCIAHRVHGPEDVFVCRRRVVL